jgi:hypothetical protein
VAGPATDELAGSGGLNTGAAATGAWAVLTDWPATEAERTRYPERLRRTVEAAAEGGSVIEP